MADQRTIEERVYAAKQWCYGNLPPIVSILLVLAALPVVLLLLMIILPRYTGIWKDDGDYYG